MQVGVAGLGAGAVQVIRAIAHAPYMQLMAAADVRPEALTAFTSRFQGRTYASVEELCRDPKVEVVWISTPNQFHCEHTITSTVSTPSPRPAMASMWWWRNPWP